MVAGARTLANAAPPHRVSLLPRDRHGYPIPWFVAELPDGSRDFRVADGTKRVTAARDHLCWVCGQILGSYRAFVVGPMCAVNRISAEPPSHRDCASYSAQCCPFLATPAMRRRERGLPTTGEDDQIDEPPGVFLRRNPGVTLVWVTRQFRPDRTSGLYRMGEPTELRWYRDGRTATLSEIREAFETGRPALEAACDEDDDPVASRAALDIEFRRALRLLPTEEIT